MWRNEINMLRQLDHVGQRAKPTSTMLTMQQMSVVKLIKHDASNLSLDLEYIGPDLAQPLDALRHSQLSKTTQHRIWTDVARGIEHIHARRIIHRDIKPKNILLGNDGRGAVICDFGVSAKVNEGTELETFNGGTPCYVPPEYLFNSPRGFECDIWAFGITMLFVLGLIPLPQGNWKIASIMQDLDVRQKMIDWLQEVRQVVKAVPDTLSPLRAMLAENPRKRITAAALAEDPFLQPLTAQTLAA